VDREGKIRFLQNLDVLSVPATYDEPKGLFLIEAMANGVPVVQPRRGAFTEVVEKTGGGILVEPDDIDSLVEGLRDLWQDPLRRVALGRAAGEGVREHYTVTRSAESLVRAYETALLERSHARAHAGSL
jgi:glycosyltransferase involved in cell wall biosynthesis